MKLIKVGAATLNQTPLDWKGNKAHIRQALDEARSQEVSVLCLPELCVTGYGAEDWYHAPDTLEIAWNVVQELLPDTRGIIVSMGIPVLHNNGLFNTACLIADGKVLGFVAKRFLAGDGIHYEPRWFKPWPFGVQGEAKIHGELFPIGDIHFDCGGVKIGFEICEDAWVAHRPGGDLSVKGVDIIMNTSASHFAFGKVEIRKRFVLEGSRAFGVTYIYTNLVGNEAGRTLYEGGALIACNGKLLAAGPRFTMADFRLTTAVVDVAGTRMSQSRSASFRPDLDRANDGCVRSDFTYPTQELARSVATLPSWETGPYAKEEEFLRSVSLGLFDYMRKSRSHGFVVSLSGGADSAAISCLVALMAALGVQELGLDGFTTRLGYMSSLKEAKSVPDLVRELLVTAYQGTENSSDVTRNAARSVAEAIGATHLELNVGSLVKSYVEMVGDALGAPITWQKHDIALQNIQARVRGPSVWLLANLRNALLLATSNRSEAAVGYATMDGDTCGGLGPIAGIDKNFLRHWLRWLETIGPEGLAPIPALKAVNVQPPTAELRPLASHQTDEDDLMPYDVLDSIERAAVRDKKGPVDTFRTLRFDFPNVAPEQMGVWIERFFKLWCRNQWKRERYAPSFYLDDESLDPRTWCRFPILSGGFERELADLRRFIAERGEV